MLVPQKARALFRQIGCFCFVLLFLAAKPIMSLNAEWISIPSADKISPRRSGHTAFSVGPSSPTFVFGGYIEQDAAQEGDPVVREVRNDLWKWDDAIQSWKQVEQSGTIPGPRLATASAVANGKAYLFGGWDPQTPGTGGIILDTVHCLDLESMEWSYLMDLPDGPTSRHVALALTGEYSNKILIHNHRCTEHVWIFDPQEQQFTKQPTTGDSPGSIGLHTATMLDENTLLVFGGAAKDGVMSNKSYLLNLKTWEWNLVDIGSSDQPCPSPRAGACLCAYTSNTMKCGILFGGAETTETGLNPKGDVWALNIDDSKKNSGHWELLKDYEESQESEQPEPRNAATLTQISSEDDATKKFLLTGGWAPFRCTWDDVFVLNLKESN